MRALFATLFLLTWTTPALAEVTVAVMEFTNAASDPELGSLGKGLQSMLTTDLSAVDAISLVERARLNEIQAEIQLGESGALDPDTAVRFGQLAGASHLIAGSFTVVGERMRLDARMFVVAADLLARPAAPHGALNSFHLSPGASRQWRRRFDFELFVELSRCVLVPRAFVA